MEKDLSEKLNRLLTQGIEKLSVEASAAQKEKLLAYLLLLDKWNKAYNLTSVRNIEQMVSKHLLDSLSVLPYLDKEPPAALWDVGSGGGLPGIPLAIMRENWLLTLVDSNSKKTGFLQQAKTELSLKNVTVLQQRAEQCQTPVGAVISRAFASLEDMLACCDGLIGPDTVVWAMKGKIPERELPEISKNYSVSAPFLLQVPGIEGDRCLLRITRKVPLPA